MLTYTERPLGRTWRKILTSPPGKPLALYKQVLPCLSIWIQLQYKLLLMWFGCEFLGLGLDLPSCKTSFREQATRLFLFPVLLLLWPMCLSVFYFPGTCRIIAVCVLFILTSRGILAGNGFMNLKDIMLISVQEPAHIYGAQILSTAG